MGYSTEWEGRLELSRFLTRKEQSEWDDIRENRHDSEYWRGDPKREYPSIWCGFEVVSARYFEWDGGEKTYQGYGWIKFFLKKLQKWSKVKEIYAEGTMEWYGEEREDVGRVIVKYDKKTNKYTVKKQEARDITYSKGVSESFKKGGNLYSEDELLTQFKGKYIDATPHYDWGTGLFTKGTQYEVRSVKDEIHENHETPSEIIYGREGYAKGGKTETMYNVYYIDHLYGGEDEYETTTNNFEKWLKEENEDREAEGEEPYEEFEFRVEEISMDKYAKGGTTKGKMKLIEEEYYGGGRQPKANYRALYNYQGDKLKVNINVDTSYDFQSSASIRIYNPEKKKWNFLASIPWQKMKTAQESPLGNFSVVYNIPSKVDSSRRKLTQDAFDADRDALLRKAEMILSDKYAEGGYVNPITAYSNEVEEQLDCETEEVCDEVIENQDVKDVIVGSYNRGDETGSVAKRLNYKYFAKGGHIMSDYTDIPMDYDISEDGDNDLSGHEFHLFDTQTGETDFDIKNEDDLQDKVREGKGRYQGKQVWYYEIDGELYRKEEDIEGSFYAKGGEVKKKGNEMIIGGLAGILLGIFLNK